MGRFAKLSFTSNPKLQNYIGCVGEIEKNFKGGYDFRMRDNGLIISTSGARQGTVLGSVDSCRAKNLGFETRSGTSYQFDFMDFERVVDGTRKVGNQFMGYEDKSLEQRLDTARAEAGVRNTQIVAASRESYLDYGK